MARDCKPVSYRQFRALGSDPFAQVRDMLAAEQNQAREAGLYMFVSRSTVLGRMKEIKERAYREYKRALARECADTIQLPGVERGPDDPF